MAKMNPYGGGDWGGLFASQGNTLDDVRTRIGQEREAKVRQAYADAIQGKGSLNAARIARAAEQQKQMMMGVAQNLFGSKDGMIKQDPRLARAVKRDQDRQEMMEMFSTAQSDGDITLAEKDAIVDEMMKRGYTGEAGKFQDIWNSRRKLDIDESLVPVKKKKAEAALKSALKKSKRFKAAGSAVYLKEEEGKTYALIHIIDEVTGKVIKRRMEVKEGELLGDKFRTTIEKIEKEGDISGAKEKARLAEGQKDKWVDVRQSMIDAGSAAKNEFKDLMRAYQLTSKTKTGGLQETVLAVRQYLGVDSGNVGELASLFRTGVISRLKEMGSKPTDKDLAYLESAVQSLGNDRETNQRILKRMVGRVNQIIARGEYLKKNPDMSREDFNNKDYEARTFDWRSEADPPVLTDKSQVPPPWQRSIGVVVRTSMGTFRWNGTKWDPIGVQ